MASVIIVDDNTSRAESIRDFLAAEGLTNVYSASSVQEAKVLFKENIYDLAIIDMALPLWSNGEEVRPFAGAELIREIDEFDFYNSPRNYIAITEHEKSFKEKSTLEKEFGVLLVSYDQQARIEDILGPTLNRVIKNDSALSFDYDFCIICALAEEEYPFENFSDLKIEKRRNKGHNLNYKEILATGKYGEIRGVILVLPQMGLVSSTAYTVKAATIFKPKLLIMSGICAGFPDTNIGDLIVATHAWEWQSGKITEDGVKKEPYQLSIDPKILSILKDSDESLANDFWKSCRESRPNDISQLHFGVMVSGSSVVADENLLNSIKTQHRKILGLEMEIYGFYYGASIVSPKSKYFAVKSVCDKGDKSKDDSFHSYCTSISADYVCNILLTVDFRELV